MKSPFSLILASAFLLFAIPVIAAQLQSGSSGPAVVSADGPMMRDRGDLDKGGSCPSGYSERASYRWDHQIHRWVFKGWVCQPNGGYGQ